MSTNPGHEVFTGFSLLNLSCWWTFWSWTKGHKAELIGPFQRLFLSSSLLVSSDGSSFCYFQSQQSWQSSLGPTALFFLSLKVTEIPWRAGSLPSTEVLLVRAQAAVPCSDVETPLCLLLSGLSWGCHSLFVHPLATCLLGFHFRKNLLRSSSLCAQPACSNRTFSRFQQEGHLDPGYSLGRTPIFQYMILPPILNFWIENVIFRSREVFCLSSFNSRCFHFFKTLIPVSKQL